jgi:hypothetical protein
LNISLLNPIEHPHWDELLLTADRATFFHTTAWARVLSESYGYKPLYFATIDNGNLAGLIPVMEIESFLTGKRGVSLPFTDICHPIADTDDIFQALMERLTQHGKSAGWKHIEIKGGSAFWGKAAAPSAEYVTHLLDLGTDENALRKTFRDSTRRNIRKAYHEGVAVTFQHTAEAMAAFYELHCRTRRRPGHPPQPGRFLENVAPSISCIGTVPCSSLAHPTGPSSICGGTTWSCGRPSNGSSATVSAACTLAAPRRRTKVCCSSSAAGVRRKIGSPITG